MKVISIAIMALLGHANAISLKDNMDEGVKDMIAQTENYAEVQSRNKEIKDAWKELQDKQLKEDTKASLASVDVNEQKIKAFDNQYTKVFGFQPQRFEIVEDVQVKDEVEDSSRTEVMAAQKEIEMKEAAAKMEKNQKLLEETMRKER